MHSSRLQLQFASALAAAALGGAAAMFPERMNALRDISYGEGSAKRNFYKPHQGEREKARRRRQMADGKLKCAIIAKAEG